MTTDATAAEKFYKDVVGWKAQDMSQGDMKYTGLLAADMPVAGLMTLPKDAAAMPAPSRAGPAISASTMSTPPPPA